MADSLVRPDYDRVRVTYSGKDWHSFSTKALMHLIDYGSALRSQPNGEGFQRGVFHYFGSTVSVDTYIPDGSMKIHLSLEFIAEEDARKIANKFMQTLKADPDKYVVGPGREPKVPRSRRVRQA